MEFKKKFKEIKSHEDDSVNPNRQILLLLKTHVARGSVRLKGTRASKQPHDEARNSPRNRNFNPIIMPPPRCFWNDCDKPFANPPMSNSIMNLS